MADNGSTKIVAGDNGDRVVVFSPTLRWMTKWVPTIGVTAVLAILGQGLLMWREQARTNTLLETHARDIASTQEALAAHLKWSQEVLQTIVSRDEWIAAKAAQNDALVNGLASIQRELGYIASGTMHNRSILEKLPVQKEKR